MLVQHQDITSLEEGEDHTVIEQSVAVILSDEISDAVPQLLTWGQPPCSPLLVEVRIALLNFAIRIQFTAQKEAASSTIIVDLNPKVEVTVFVNN